MPRQVNVQTNFTAGELSPRLYARVDVNKYDNGLEVAKNCVVQPHGPCRKRNGFQYIADTKNHTQACRLIPFQFSNDDSFILEFGHQYIRFYTLSAQVQSMGSPYEISTPYSSTELQDLSYQQFGNKIYLAHGSYEPRVLTRNSTTDWSLETLSMSPPPTYESGERPTASLTPGATTGTGITFTSSTSFIQADVGRQIVNTSGTGRASIVSYTDTSNVVCDILEDFPSTSSIPSGSWYLDLSSVAELSLGGTITGSVITVTADDIGTSTAINTFRSTDIGSYIYINQGVLKIVSINSPSNIDCEVIKSPSTANESSAWTLETPTWTSSRGYPNAVTLHQQRLVFGGTTEEPQTLWFSRAGQFTDFARGTEDADAITVTVSSSSVNAIKWLGSARDLVVGTSGGEGTISAPNKASITATNITYTPRTAHGSSPQSPSVIGSEVVFVDGSQTRVRSFRYDFNIDNYIGQDLTFLAEHISSDQVKELAYAETPDSILYCVTNSGDLLTCSFIREQEVLGWSKTQTDGLFEQIQTINSGAQTQVWVVVNRTIGGVTKRYIELLDSGDGTDRIDGYCDSFLTYSDPKVVSGITQANPGVVTTSSAHGYSDGDLVKLVDVLGMTQVNGMTYKVANSTSTTFELNDQNDNSVDTTSYTAYSSGGEAHELITTVSGLDHLEGKTLKLRVDGATHPDKTVSSGSITLDRNSYEVVAGLPYTFEVKTLRKSYDLGSGPMQGQRTRFPRPILRVYRSIKPMINGEYIPARSFADKADEAVPLYSGDLYYGNIPWTDTGQMTITSTEPLPLVLQGIFGIIEGNIK